MKKLNTPSEKQLLTMSYEEEDELSKYCYHGTIKNLLNSNLIFNEEKIFKNKLVKIIFSKIRIPIPKKGLNNICVLSKKKCAHQLKITFLKI